MVKISRGVYTHTVTLDDRRYKTRFQIWLDGDFQRVLHPDWPGAWSSAPVSGPHPGDQTCDLTWLLCAEDQQENGEPDPRSSSYLAEWVGDHEASPYLVAHADSKG